MQRSIRKENESSEDGEIQEASSRREANGELETVRVHGRDAPASGEERHVHIQCAVCQQRLHASTATGYVRCSCGQILEGEFVGTRASVALPHPPPPPCSDIMSTWCMHTVPKNAPTVVTEEQKSRWRRFREKRQQRKAQRKFKRRQKAATCSLVRGSQTAEGDTVTLTVQIVAVAEQIVEFVILFLTAAQMVYVVIRYRQDNRKAHNNGCNAWYRYQVPVFFHLFGYH